MEFLRKKKKQKTNKELYNSHVSDVLFLIHVFTFSQTLLLAFANKLTTKSQNHLHIMCFVYLYGKYEKIATIINLIFFVYKSWEEMLITTLQTSTKWERLLNLYIRKQFSPHTWQQVQVSVLLPCQYSHLYHYQCHYTAYQNYYASYFHSRLFHCRHFCHVITG